jgi:hypothetical protein
VPSQRFVYEQRLRRVPARLERLHQQPVPALAVRRALDQLPSRSLRRVELAAADREAGTPHQLERADEDLLQAPPLRVDPRRVLARQKLARRDVLGDPSGAPGTDEVSLRDRALRPVQPFGGRLEVDPGVVRKREPHVAAPLERNDLPELRDERAEPFGPARFAPERVAELVSRDRRRRFAARYANASRP